MIDLLYLALRERIREVTALNEVNIYLGQPENGEDGYPLYSTPAVFIRFDSIVTASHMTASKLPNKQVGDVTFSVILIDESVLDSDEALLNSNLGHMIKFNELFKKLQNHASTLADLPGNGSLAGTANNWIIHNPLNRVSIALQQSKGGVIVSTQQYNCKANDLCMIDEYAEIIQNVIAKINLEVNF